MITGFTEDLKNEHRYIERMIKVLEKQAHQLEADKPVDGDLIVKSTSLASNFMNQRHHAKEEKILYGFSSKNLNHQDDEMIKVLLLEHDQGRAYVQQLRQLAFSYESGNQPSKDEIIRLIKEYAKLLTHHIGHEDIALWPLAEATFAEQEKKDFLVSFNDIDDRLPLEPYLKTLQDLE